MEEREHVRKRLDEILLELLSLTGASRTTLRLDDLSYNFNVDDVCGEALLPGEATLRGQTSINQRAAATAQWVERERRILVQNDVSQTDPAPPPALLRLYGVKAQMLGPIVRDGQLLGWISVHETRAPRIWTDLEITAVGNAADDVLGIL